MLRHVLYGCALFQTGKLSQEPLHAFVTAHSCNNKIGMWILSLIVSMEFLGSNADFILPARSWGTIWSRSLRLVTIEFSFFSLSVFSELRTEVVTLSSLTSSMLLKNLASPNQMLKSLVE